MKRRWSVLFWSCLACLIGFSWFASTFGVSIAALIGMSFLGMIAGTVIAGYAMVRGIRAKWPAAVVLVCAGPMALEILRSLPDLLSLIRFIGLSYALIVTGAVATVVTAIRTLVQPLPSPPDPPPIAPARVVD